MALDFWFVTYTLQKSVMIRKKKKKNKPDSSRIYLAHSWGQIQSRGGQRKFLDGFHKKDLSYQWLNIAEMNI